MSERNRGIVTTMRYTNRRILLLLLLPLHSPAN